MPETQHDLLSSIDRKLSILIALSAYERVTGETVAEGAPILRRLGLSRFEIAAIFDTSANAVSVRIAEAKKRTAKPKSK